MLILRIALPWVFLFSLVLVVPAARAEGKRPAADPTARTAFEAGREAYVRGQFQDALAWFERAYALSPHPKLMFNIGRAADGNAQYARALEAYESYLASVGQEDNREFVEARIAKLKEALAQPEAAAALSPEAVAVLSVDARETSAGPLLAPTRSDSEPPKRFWRRGWFWGGAAVIVAGAVITGALLATRSQGENAAPSVDETIMTLQER